MVKSKSARKAKKSRDQGEAAAPRSAKNAAKLHRKRLGTPIEKYSRGEIEKSLKIDVKALGIPAGSAEIFIDKTLDAVESSLGSRRIITEHDLKSAIVRELKKYHKDFAYIYQNRDKII